MAKYEILHKLGEGGFAITFLAKNAIGQRYALKSVQHEEEALKEARRLIEVGRHPNIVDVIDVVGPDEVDGDVRQDRYYYIVMDYLDGETLTHHLKQAQMLSPEAWWRLLSEILDGVGHMHDNGYVHRDIKPDNIIIVTENGVRRPIVIDLGLAKPADLHTETIGGTPGYRPPEWDKPDLIGRWSDIYQLARLSFQALYGDFDLYDDDEEMQTELKSTRTRFQSALARGLERKTEDRPQSVWDWVISMVEPSRTLGVAQSDDTANTSSYLESSSGVSGQSSEEHTVVTGDMSIAELRHEIEKDFRLPIGCIAILHDRYDTQSIAHGKTLLRTFRDDHPNAGVYQGDNEDYSSEVEEGESLSTLAKNIGQRHGLHEGCVRFVKPGPGPAVDRLIDRKSLVSTMREMF